MHVCVYNVSQVFFPFIYTFYRVFFPQKIVRSVTVVYITDLPCAFYLQHFYVICV